MAKSIKAKVNLTLSILSERERRIIEERLGLKDGKPKTRNQVIQMFAVTNEKIKNVERKVLQLLETIN